MKTDSAKSSRSICRRFGGTLKALVAVGAAAFALSAQADTKKIGDYTWSYTTIKGGVRLEGDMGDLAVSPKPVGYLAIPEKIGKLAVKEIGSEAFNGCDGLQSVRIPKGVTKIRSKAFLGCTSLKSVTVPSTVTSIEMMAFQNCSSLESIAIPKGVTGIAPYTFKDCTSLRMVSIPSTVKTIGNYAFSGCTSLISTTLAYVDTIASYAFEGSAMVTVGTKAKFIDSYAFFNCKVLKSVALLSGASVIDDNAFDGCNQLEILRLPHSVSTMGFDAFNTAPLKKIYYEYDGEEGVQSDKDRFKELLAGTGMSATTINAIEFSLWCTLTVKPNSTKYGKAVIVEEDEGETYTYTSSRCPAEEMVEILATPKKGYYFAGWYQDKALKKPLNADFFWYGVSDYRQKRLDIAMPRKHTTIYAKFITKAAAKKSLKFSAATKKLAKTATAGSPEKDVLIQVAASSATLTALSAKGLPKGMSFDPVTRTIAGKPTVPGTHYVTITAKDAAGNKISQKVKISAEVMSWSRGTYYGRAMVDSSSVPAIAQCTVAKTGKVSGKITYKGKAYSFSAKCSSSTVDATKFPVKVKIGSKTFSTGTVTAFKAGTAFPVVCAESVGNSFIVQKSPGLIKTGGALEQYIGKTFTVSGSDEGSSLWGLKKKTDKLTFKIVSGDLVQFSGTVNGAKFSATSAPLRLIYNTLDRSADYGVIKEIDEGEEYTTYKLYADLVALKGKYFHPLMIEVTVDSSGSIQLESWQ